MHIHTVDTYEKMAYCEVLYIHCIRSSNDIRSAVTMQIKEKHHQHRTVSRVSWGLAVHVTW